MLLDMCPLFGGKGLGNVIVSGYLSYLFEFECYITWYITVSQDWFSLGIRLLTDTLHGYLSYECYIWEYMALGSHLTC